MLDGILSPLSDWGPLILRLSMGITFFVHGWFKVNPQGPVKGPAGFAPGLKQIGIPLPLLFAWLVVLLETVGAILLVLGLGTRILAALYAIEMLVVILVAKRRAWKIPFFAQQTTGWELDFVLLGQALGLVFLGGGALALDQVVGL